MGDNLLNGLCEESSTDNADRNSLSGFEDFASANGIKRVHLSFQDMQQQGRSHSSKLSYCLNNKYNSKALQHLQ